MRERGAGRRAEGVVSSSFSRTSSEAALALLRSAKAFSVTADASTSDISDFNSLRCQASGPDFHSCHASHASCCLGLHVHVSDVT